MAILTTTRGFRYPENNTAPDIQRDFSNLATDIDGQYIESIAASRPAAGKVGRRHRATDTGQETLDIGSAWVDASNPDNSSLQRTLGGLLIVKDGGITAVKISDALKPSAGAAAGTEALRALGLSGTTAAAGNDTRIVQAVQGGTNLLRTIVGRVQSNGTILGGNGYTVTKGSTGVYTLNFALSFSAVPTVLPTLQTGGSGRIVLSDGPSISSTGIRVFLADGATLVDSLFHFEVTGPQ